MRVDIKLPRRPKPPKTDSPPVFGASVGLSISVRGESSDWIAMNIRPLNADSTLFASTMMVAMHLNKGAIFASNGPTAVDSVRFSGGITQLWQGTLGGARLNHWLLIHPGGSAWVLTKKTGTNNYTFSFWPGIAGQGDAASASWV